MPKLNTKLQALHCIEDNIHQVHLCAVEGEPYHPTYKKYRDLFRMIVRSDMETERVMKRYFKDQAKRSKGFINWKLYEKEAKKVRQGAIDDFFIVDWTKESLNMKVLLTQSLIDAVVAGGKMTENDTNIVIGWNRKHPPVQEFLKKHTFELAGQLTKTTKKRINKALQLSISNGESTKEAQARIADIIDDPRRAGVIAHTESVRAFSEGRLQVAQEIGADRKQWDATFGACAICQPMDGQVRKLSESFKGGDGNPYKAPPAHPNCRCLIKILMPGEKTPATTPTKPKPKPKTIRVGEGNFKVSNNEKKFIEDKGITFTEVKNRRKSEGSYFPRTGKIDLKKVKSTARARQTFFHELGHAIDYETDIGILERGRTEALKKRLSKKPEFREVYRADGLNVIKNRILVSSKTSANYFKDSDILSYIRGESIDAYSNKTNKIVGKTSISARYRKYIRSDIEVFGDGYSQFRVDPKGFKKYAPKMYDYFLKVFN